MISFPKRRALTVRRPVAAAETGLRVGIVDDEAGLLRLREDWGALYASCVRPSLCASHDWASAWWGAFARDDWGLFVVVVRDAEGEVVGIVPFFEERSRRGLRVRRLRALGSLGHDGCFDMTEEPILLVRPGREAAAFAAMAATLRGFLRRGRWDTVAMRHLDPETASPIAAAFRELGGWAYVDSRGGSDVAALPATWAEYRKAMSRSMRDNLAYYPRLLTRDGHAWEVRTSRETDAVDRLVDLHRARASSERGPRHVDHLHGPSQVAFLRGLVATHPGAFVAELVVDGEVVASHAFVEHGDTLMVYYSGYGEAWAKYSPIFVIDAAIFQAAMARGVRRLDFLRNPAPWKARWLAEPGPRLHRASATSLRPDCLLRTGVHLVAMGYRRNVSARLPALRERWLRLLLPAVPHLEHLARRAGPTLHVLAVQAPLHRHLAWR